MNRSEDGSVPIGGSDVIMVGVTRTCVAFVMGTSHTIVHVPDASVTQLA